MKILHVLLVSQSWAFINPCRGFVSPTTTMKRQSSLLFMDFTESASSLQTALIVMDGQSNLKPAVGHSQPFWGPPDPYLTAGKSIVPPHTPLTTTSEYSEVVQAAARKGWPILDGSTLTPESILPGFTPTGGILGTSHIPGDSVGSFAGQVDYAVWFLPIFQKLPLCVFLYCLVDFFVLRPNLNVYQDEEGAVAEAVATSTVRLAAFGVVGLLTVTLLG